MPEAEELCAAFETAALRDFDYLKRDYGFSVTETGGEGIEDWVLFKSPTAGIRVMYEVGASPWVQILRLAPGKAGIEGAEISSLELLLVERDPTYRDREYKFGELSAEQLGEIVAEKAKKLKEFGEDILKGDFRVFARLSELAEENRRRRSGNLPG
jgi:hypothetical protein